MALTDFPPIPAELAGDAPPLTDDELEAYFAFIDDHAELGVEGVASSLADLDEHPEDFRDDLQPVVAAHRFRVDEDGKAEWALRKLAAAEADVERLRLQAEDWTARITAWFQQAAKRPVQTVAYMTGQLERYALDRREETGAATLTLPSGVVSTREQKPAPQVDDDETVGAVLRRAYSGAEGVAWKLAVEELDGDKPLMTTTTKVYADQFKKLVRVAPHPTGVVEWTITLRCGHEELVTGHPDEITVPEIGEVVTCPVCAGDESVSEPVAAVSMQPLMELAVLGPDDRPVAGAVVKPGEIKASVKVR